jgi:hypothetical protein
VPTGRPTFLDELVRVGFDPGLLDDGHTEWARNGAVLDLTRAEIGR